jgi:hypothetical protein
MTSVIPFRFNAKGSITSPLPLHNCGVLRTKNAVSLPSSAARAISSASDSPSANSSLTASNTAVPSDDPPPSPAPKGTRLPRRIATPSTP